MIQQWTYLIGTISIIHITLGIIVVDKAISYTHTFNHFIYTVILQCDRINIIGMAWNVIQLQIQQQVIKIYCY